MTGATKGGIEPSQAQVDALAAGDSSAWSCVVRWLQPQLDGFYIARGGSGTDYESLTQETLLRMSRHIARFQDGGAHELRAWAFAIARTVGIDAARRAAVRPPRAAAGEADHAEQPDANLPFDEHVAAIDRVEHLLDQLTPQQAELLRLRIHGDLTLEHAAASVGMGVDAAKQLQRRALRKLASLLQDDASTTAEPDAHVPTSADTGVNRTSGTPP